MIHKLSGGRITLIINEEHIAHTIAEKARVKARDRMQRNREAMAA